MQEVISLILFIAPGFLLSFWIGLFGITPSSKQRSSEVAIISALLWVPVVFFVLITYNLFILFSKISFLQQYILHNKELVYIYDFNNLALMSENVWFVLSYVFLSIFVSYLLARLMSGRLYKKALKQINAVRKRNNIAPLSKHSTVWNETFLNNLAQVVEYKKIGDKHSITGILLRVPRANESENSIVLEAVTYWGNIMEYYDVEIEQTYVDMDKGIIINIYNSEEAKIAQDCFNKRFPDGITS